jgi:hypothetical protein
MHGSHYVTTRLLLFVRLHRCAGLSAALLPQIRHDIGNNDGTFHLWPAMDGWTDPDTQDHTNCNSAAANSNSAAG